MKIFHFQQQGKRPYQEDTLFFNGEAGLFLVCDGVGGSAKGEVASSLVAQTIEACVEKAGGQITDEPAVRRMVQEAQQALQKRLVEHPVEAEMGTTLAMLHLQGNGALVAHVGDSRIYYVKPEAGLYWRTTDHSHVQLLYDTGVLKTEEEMSTHPMRSMISRAIQAKSDAGMAEPDVSMVQNLQPGDLFLLCSDGVLEPYTPTDFIALLGDVALGPEAKIEALKTACAAESRDNNSCILLEIEATDVPQNAMGEPGLTMRPVPSMVALKEEEHTYPSSGEMNQPLKTADAPTLSQKQDKLVLNRGRFWLLIGIMLLTVFLITVVQRVKKNKINSFEKTGHYLEYSFPKFPIS